MADDVSYRLEVMGARQALHFHNQAFIYSSECCSVWQAVLFSSITTNKHSSHMAVKQTNTHIKHSNNHFNRRRDRSRSLSQSSRSRDRVRVLIVVGCEMLLKLARCSSRVVQGVLDHKVEDMVLSIAALESLASRLDIFFLVHQSVTLR